MTRVPYIDPPFVEQYNPEEISLGYGEREIGHLLDIVANAESSIPAVKKALQLLSACVRGCSAEPEVIATLLSALDRTTNSGVLLQILLTLDCALVTVSGANQVEPAVPQIVTALESDEVSIAFAAACLLKHIGELADAALLDDEIPQRLVDVTFATTNSEVLDKLYTLLAGLGTTAVVRVPLIANTKLVAKIVADLGKEALKTSALSLSCSIASDSSHEGKAALLDAGVIDALVPRLKDFSTRSSALGLTCLMAVTGDGKQLLAMSPEVADLLKRLSETDADLFSRRAAYEARVLIAELPLGRVIAGGPIDSSVIPRAADSSKQAEGVLRTNPKFGELPATSYLSPTDAAYIVKPGQPRGARDAL